jgi:ATP-dependent RNA helicase SUPV3L1/SUV3
LSDALHERLTKRFVDRRTSVLVRRLRENTMLEAEISPSGTVVVEGHHVGELQGFRFTADQSANGEDGKAIRAAAQKGLAAEFETRAERFSASANGDLALGSDGVLRWIGAPIGTLAAGEDALKPRVILLADEQLTGPARDKVAARADRFVNFQIESLLKPLVDLKNADQIIGIGRGIAFRLVEEFGLINRRDIAEDVKSLDQAGRAALRRLGVRFGAYHIFVPLLIKPAPAGLITLLWALKNDGKEKPGFGDVVHALASGRTSVVVDPAFDRTFYKLAGYRPLGRRAVRVDILERLADLIRPALSWKAGLGARPDGAYDGQAFTVTPPMMSILGANADDMEEILKGLGYRAEPKPAADVKARLEALDQAAREAAAKAEAEKAEAAARAAAEQQTATAAEAEAPVEQADATATAEQVETSSDASTPSPDEPAAQPESAPLEAATWTPDVEEAPSIEAAASSPLAGEVSPLGSGQGPAQGQAPATEAGGEESVAHPEIGAAEQATAELVSTTPTPALRADPPRTGEGVADAEPDILTPEAGPAVPAEEPKPILLWRPGRFDRQGGPRRHDQRQRRGRGPVEAATETGDRPAQPRQDGRPPFRGRREGGEGADSAGGKPKFNRDRYKGPPKPQGEGARPDFRKGKPQEARDRDGRGPNGRQERGQKPAFQPRPREERPAQIDPLSPFAKLAALRDQLQPKK